MKKTYLIFCVLFLLNSAFCFAQGELDGYQIIYIPVQTFKGMDSAKDKTNEIHLKAKAAFEKIGFTVYDDVKQLPNRIIENKCEVLYCAPDFSTKKDIDPRNIKHTYCIVNLNIKDCRDSILKNVECLDEFPGLAWADIYLEAVQKAAKRIGRHYKYDASKKEKRIKAWFPAVEMTNETEETLMLYFSSHKLDSIEGIYETAFKNPAMSYYKIGIKKYGDAYKAIIIESDFLAWKPGEVKAFLKKDALSAVKYSAKWYYRDKFPLDTYCEYDYENGLLMLATGQGQAPRTDTLKKIFPKK